MINFWRVFTKQEKHLAITTLAFCAISSVLFFLNHKDIYILAFYLLLCSVTLLLIILSAWILNKIPFIPRLLSPLVGCTFLAMIFGLPFAASVSLVSAIVSSSLFLTNQEQPKWAQKTKWGLLLVALVSITYLVMFFVSKGNHLEQQPLSQIEKSIKPKGFNYQYEIEHFTYGSGTDINREEYAAGARFLTQSVNAEAIVDNWQGFSGWYRSFYWGFDLTNLPLNANVWMPKESGKHPLVLIVHGDHAMQDYSEHGYAYLAEHLAKLGYVVVSIDQNFLNRSWSDLLLSFPLQDENDARAWLMLEHVNLWKNWSENPSHPLFNKIDKTKISLIGHSRGGEAASVAAAFSKLEHHPDFPAFRFNYDFGITSVVAIAPVDGQYRPKGKLNDLAGINYLLLQGSQDGEMHYAGAGQYARADITYNRSIYKYAHYIYGANHGQFNTSWGENDHEFFSPYSSRWNLAELMPEALQLNIAKHTITHFLELTLKQNKEHFESLKHPQYLSFEYPIHVQHGNSRYKILETFQPKPLNISSSGIGYIAKERIANGSHAQKISWNNCDAEDSCRLNLRLKSPQKFSSINIDLANNTNIPTDINFELEYSDQTKSKISLSEQTFLAPRLDRILKKSLVFPPKINHEIVFTTYSFDTSSLDPSKQLDSIKFIFENSGEIYLDNLVGY